MAVLKDIESRDPLSEISEQEKELLWTFRSLVFLSILTKPVPVGMDPNSSLWRGSESYVETRIHILKGTVA